MIKKLFLTTFALTALSYADDFVIGVEEMSYFPIYDNEAGEYIGYARELLDQFAKDSGHKFTYNILPINKLYLALTTFKVDFKFPDNEHWQEEIKIGKNIKYSDGVFTNLDVIHVLPENEGKGVEFLKTIGTINGFTPWPVYEKVQKGEIKVLYYTSTSGLINQCKLGNVDGIYMSAYIMHYNLKKLNKPNIVVFDKSIPYFKHDFKLSSIKYPDIIIQFNLWAKNNKKYITDLKKKYDLNENLE
jgi:ABC-type amino acid transport substrate-binding protein